MVIQEFSIGDYAVLGLTLIITMIIGICCGWKGQKSNLEFLLASRSMSPFPMALSVLASTQSAILILGTTAETYAHGLLVMYNLIGNVLAGIIAGWVFLPIYFNLKITSVYEYLEIRFRSRIPRYFGSSIFVVQNILFLGVALYSPTIALNTFTPLTTWMSILLMGIICVIYTTLGGMRAVVWTDVFQAGVMFVGLLSILIRALQVSGGINRAWDLATLTGRTNLVEFSPDPFMRHTFWNLVASSFIVWGSYYSCGQTQMQRFYSVPTLNKGKLTLFLNLPGQVILEGLTYVSGILIFASYFGCDPLKAGIVEQKDQIVPYFVMNQFGYIQGLPGLFMSCLVSGALSSISSILNSLAAVTWEEIKLVPLFSRLDVRETFFTKGLAMLYGLMAIGLAFLGSRMGGLLQLSASTLGALTGPIFGMFILAVLFPFVNSKGAVIGLLFGQVLNLWISFGAMGYASPPTILPLSTDNCTMSNTTMGEGYSHNATLSGFHMEAGGTTSSTLPPDMTTDTAHTLGSLELMYSLSYRMMPIIGFLTTVFVGLIASLTTGGQHMGENEKHLINPVSWKVYVLCNGKNRSQPVKSSQDSSVEEMDVLNTPQHIC